MVCFVMEGHICFWSKTTQNNLVELKKFSYQYITRTWHAKYAHSFIALPPQIFVAETLNNWGEPEWAPHKRYSCARIIYYYGTSVTRNICPVWLYGLKCEIFDCAFSCLGYAPYICRPNLANCKFTLVPAVLFHCIALVSSYTVPRRAPKEERVRQNSSSAQQRKDQLRTW